MSARAERSARTDTSSPAASARVDAAAEPVRTAVVGYGYWGPNLVRNIVERPELDLVGLCELDDEPGRRFSASAIPASRSGELDDVLPTRT